MAHVFGMYRENFQTFSIVLYVRLLEWVKWFWLGLTSLAYFRNGQSLDLGVCANHIDEMSKMYLGFRRNDS